MRSVEIIRVLLIENNPEDAQLIREMLAKARGARFDLECADRLSTGMKRLARGGIDVVLLDLSLPDSRGLNTFHRLYAQIPQAPIIVLSVPEDEELAVNAVRKGAQDYLVKGQVDSNLLLRAVRYAIERRRMLAELEQGVRELQASETRFRNIIEKNVDGIIIVDREGVIRFVNPASESLFGRKAEDLLGQVFGFPVMAGKTTELDITGRGGETVVVVEMRVAETNWDGEIACLATIRDITEHVQAKKELQRSLEKLRKAIEGTVHAMALTVEIRDPYTAGHQRRVAELALAIAAEMEFSEDRLDGIRMAGVIHDLGKISVPAEILSKPGRITKSEFDIIKAHPQVGYDILKEIDFPWPLAQITLQHHERMDGSGYPQGLSGEEILLEAKILGVADVVEAMASHRPYRPALGTDKALEEISKNRGILYDPEVVDACLKLFLEGFQLEGT